MSVTADGRKVLGTKRDARTERLANVLSSEFTRSGIEATQGSRTTDRATSPVPVVSHVREERNR